MMQAAPADAIQYCHKLVQTHDKDRYLASLFMPDGKRELVWSLYALNIELQQIRDKISDPMPGTARLQWWRDAIEDVYAGNIKQHPVIQLLAKAIETGDLPAHTFRNMIEARQFDLYEDPMPGLNDLEGYLGETNSALIQLAALILAGYDALGSSDVSGLGGVAHGMVQLLKALPLQRSRGQCYLPQDFLSRYELTPAHILSGRGETAFELVLSTYLQHAAQRLQEMRAQAHKVPDAALPAYVHLALVDGDIAALRKAGSSVLTKTIRPVQWRRQLRLWWMNRTEQF